MKYLRIFLIISVFLCPTIIRADIYRYVDPDGIVHFTNTPGDSKGDLYLREAPKGPPPGKGNGWMIEYAERYSRANNLSPALVKAIIKAESNGERYAVSPKGAQGMMHTSRNCSEHLGEISSSPWPLTTPAPRR
jgi:soluble lytic murein transglycosylase